MDSDSETSDSSTSTSSSEGVSVPDEERLEPALILGATVELPQDLCENPAIFKEFFSINTWNCLSEANKQHLRNFLPSFPDNDQEEKEISLNKLFSREVFKFTSPLVEFQKNLHEGNYRPDIAKMREILKKTRRKEQRFEERERCSQLLKDVLMSRQKLLDVAYNSPPGVPLKVERSPYNPPKQGMNPTALRAKKRYFQELSNIVAEVGMPGHISDDENYPEGPIPQLSRKQRRHLSGMQGGATSPGAEERVYSTMCTREGSLDHLVGPGGSAPLSEESYKLILTTHKKRRLDHDDHPELDISGITLYDISARTRAAGGHRRPIQVFMPHNQESKSKKSAKTIKSETTAIKAIQATKNIEQPEIRPSPILPGQSRAAFHHGYSTNSDSENDSMLDAVDSPVILKKPVKAPSKRTAAGGKSNKPKTKVTDPTFSIVGMTSPIVHAKGENITISHNIEPFMPQVSEPPNVINHSSYSIRGTAATLSDLEGIDMMHLPVDLDDSNIDILDEINEKTPELMQETHVCFLSLIRDIICSTADHRILLEDLEKQLIMWQENPISPLNDWYNLADNWSAMLGSVIQFLTGEFSDQPDDFVPYLEYKPNLQMYQWIGAGRDSDNLLVPLCQYWLEHKNSMAPPPQIHTTLETETGVAERPQTPPPPKCPTSWKVRKATSEEVTEFQRQERLRYEHPHKAFTYRMHGYESVVAPIKGVYHQSPGIAKARGHSMLNADRPNFVTILTLVRDATARLPNGEGTRAEICEMLRCSQYISGDAADNVLQSVVSGALDRMHTEYDPCVKYDPKRKIWIYLHRNRTESEFERVHQQIQSMGKHKKAANRKPAKPKAVKVPKNSNKNSMEPSSPMQTSDGNIEMKPETDISMDFTVQNPTKMLLSSEKTTKVVKPLLEKPVKVSKPVVHRNQISVQNVQVETSDGKQTIPIQIASAPPNKSYTSLLNPNNRSQSPTVRISPKVNDMSAVSIETTTNTENSDTVSVAISIAQSTKNITVQKRTNSPMGSKIALKNLIATPMQSPKTGKSLVKLATGKSLINPNAVNQNQQVLVNINTKHNINMITPEQIITQKTNASLKNNVSATQIQSTTSCTLGVLKPKFTQAVSQAKPVTATTLTPSQKQQFLQNILTQQQKQQLLQNLVQTQKIQQQNSAGVLAKQMTQQASSQHQLVTQQQLLQTLANSQQQKQQAVSVNSAVTTQVQQTVAYTPQQVLQSIAGQQKVNAQQTTTLTPAQQQQIIQSLKQQQLKNQQTGQYQVLLKQQAIQQLQKQLQQSGVSGANVIPKSVSSASLLSTNVQRSTIKTQNTQQQPIMTKLLTNASGQVISVESLLGKQANIIQQGQQTLRVTPKQGQNHLIQLSSGPSNQVQQFAMVSQGNIISMSNARMVTASVANTVTINSPQNNPRLMKPTVQQASTKQTNQKLLQQQLTQQLVNAKLLGLQNAQGKIITSPVHKQGIIRSGVKVSNAGNTIRMVNTAGLNIAHIGGKPVILASKGSQLQGQNVILQTAAQNDSSSNLMISGQTLKVPSNMITTGGNLNIINTNQNQNTNTQTVMLGGQMIKVQNPQQNLTQTGSNIISQPQQTVMLSGQTIKVQNQQTQNSVALNQQQQVMLGQAIKVQGAQLKGQSPLQGQRVVLTSQGQSGQLLTQQILLPPGFQGGAINIKTLQGLKVIPIAQQTKGTLGGRQQVFARLIAPPAPPRPPPPGGE